jgi:hypothetical protein
MEQPTGTTIITADQDVTMNWGAIFGGWLIATGIMTLLYLGGLAAGYSGFGSFDAATSAGSMTGIAIWMVITWAASLFLGGMFASWFDGKNDQTVGTLHGITVWGMAVTTHTLLFILGVMHGMHGAAAGENVVHHAPMAMGVACLSIFAALLASALGGWLGAGHIHKVHHLRNYDTPIARK